MFVNTTPMIEKTTSVSQKTTKRPIETCPPQLAIDRLRGQVWFFHWIFTLVETMILSFKVHFAFATEPAPTKPRLYVKSVPFCRRLIQIKGAKLCQKH